jgi:exodeoxyribonuclease V alpha subunit
MTEVSGAIASVIYQNEGNGFAIIRLSLSDDKGDVKALGTMPGAKKGMLCALEGKYETDPKFGEQFRFSSFKEKEPQDKFGIEAFLSSGIISGIGPKTAGLIVKSFGEDSLKVIEDEPEKLLEISGIGDKTLVKIVESYAEHREIAEITLYFAKYEIDRSAVMKLYKKYGAETIEKVRENPYRLVSEVEGIGFKTADYIAQNLGLLFDSGDRIKAGIIYVLQNAATGQGHTYLPEAELTEALIELLDVSSENIEDELLAMVLEGKIDKRSLSGVEAVFLSEYFIAEKKIANDLLRLMNADVRHVNADTESLIASMEDAKGIVLSELQKIAVRNSLTSPVFVLTGGPGTGKTTITGAVLDILHSVDFEVAIAAPTGRAAKRIAESTGYDAKTIHRLLEYTVTPGTDRMYFGRDSSCPLEVDAVVVDEASMIDVLLMKALLDAMPSGARLILVGDADQLPPVGAGNVLKDMLSSERVDFENLEEIYRQAEESMIVVNAHRINHGEAPLTDREDSNFFLYRKDTAEEALPTILDLAKTRLPKYLELSGKGAMQRIQVITPVKAGPLGTVNLNVNLQESLNPQDGTKVEIKYGNRIFREGDKVMQMKNDYYLLWTDTKSFEEGEGIFNGDIGFVESIDADYSVVNVIFDGSRRVSYNSENIANLEHAFAITVHKSQGSEFSAIVMPVMSIPPMLATRNLIYTAITRGKELDVLVGSERSMMRMIENDSSGNRYSALGDFLSENLSGF